MPERAAEPADTALLPSDTGEPELESKNSTEPEAAAGDTVAVSVTGAPRRALEVGDAASEVVVGHDAEQVIE